MREVGGLLWAVATAIGACLFWLALGQMAFLATGTDPLDLLTRGEVAGSSLVMLAIWAAGVLIYAALARAKFRRGQARREPGGA